MTHPADALADHQLGLLGAETLAQCRRADDVGKQCGDEPELVLTGSCRRRPESRGEDGAAGLDRLTLDLEGHTAELDEVACAQRPRPLEPLAVDPGAVERAEVLDLQYARGDADHGMPPGDERIVDGEVANDTADDQLSLDRDSLPGQRPFFHQQRGHSGESSPGGFSRPSAADDHGVPVIRAIAVEAKLLADLRTALADRVVERIPPAADDRRRAAGLGRGAEHVHVILCSRASRGSRR